MVSNSFETALGAVSGMRPQPPDLTPLPFLISMKKARELAKELHRTAPRNKNCILIDESSTIMLVCTDGMIFHAIKFPDGSANVVCAEGLLEVQGGETARA